MAQIKEGQAGNFGITLSRVMTYRDRAAFLEFAQEATIGHWCEVIDAMKAELIRERRDPKTGRPL